MWFSQSIYVKFTLKEGGCQIHLAVTLDYLSKPLQHLLIWGGKLALIGCNYCPG